jgi:hypothetical protein
MASPAQLEPAAAAPQAQAFAPTHKIVFRIQDADTDQNAAVMRHEENGVERVYVSVTDRPRGETVMFTLADFRRMVAAVEHEVAE